MFDPASVRFRGPLAPHVHGFWSELMRQGYAPYSGRNQLLVAAHVSRWLEDRGLNLGDLTVDRMVRFARHRRRKGYTAFLTPRALSPLITYLRRLGLAPPAPPPPRTPLDRLLEGYSVYLTQMRGLVRATIRGYAGIARRFVVDRFGPGCLRWRLLATSDVTRFVLREARCSSVGHSKHVVTVLRSLLRFLHLRGLIKRDLATSVPAVAGWRLASLPKGIEPEQVERMLRSCNPQTIVGVRDRAIVRLLARLGLRAGEVAALRLEDIDWRAAEVVIRGKGRREGRLPLPPDVGKAVAAYLRRRPRFDGRAVFLSVHAPHRPMTTHAVSSVATHLLREIGVSSGSAHRLRHTAATQMVRHGASLAEVSHVLRHRHVDTTAIYAKVDHASLRTLVRPWPGGAA